jgi:hypothetical protein
MKYSSYSELPVILFMIWGVVAPKMHSLKLQLHKSGRFHITHSES